jgi:hypothetical protein
MLTTRPAFFKLWSSGSALVVLGLTFYEINYRAYIDVLLYNILDSLQLLKKTNMYFLLSTL